MCTKLHGRSVLTSITEARELKWQEDYAERKKHKGERRHEEDDYANDGEEDERRTPLAIEQPPPPAPFDPRMPLQQNPLGRAMSGAAPIPAINVNGRSGEQSMPPTYSDNA